MPGPFVWLALALAAFGQACGGTKTPTSPTTTTSTTVPAGTDTWSSTLAPRGTSSRSLVIPTAGTVTVTLASIALPATTEVGLGIGISSPGGSGCFLSTSINASVASASTLTTAVDPGTYCVALYDLGTLTEVVGFRVSISHP